MSQNNTKPWIKNPVEYHERFYKRFTKKIIKHGALGCWDWKGGTGSHMYGTISYKGYPNLVHRLSYIFNVGDIPTGMTVDHLCRNRLCMNPHHLELVTLEINSSRASLKGVCQMHGLPFDRVYYKRNGSENRQCSLCQKEWNKRRYL